MLRLKLTELDVHAAHRPKSHWLSNMHLLSPADETDYLTILSAGGFEKVLESIKAYFNLNVNGLSAYHSSLIGVSLSQHSVKNEDSYILMSTTSDSDVNDSGAGAGVAAFNLMISLILVEGEGTELEILPDNETTTRYYQYETNVNVG